MMWKLPVAVRIAYNCGVYIPFSDDKHQFVRDSSLCTLEMRDNVRNNFFVNFFFFQQNVSLIFSWTEFCLGLHTAVHLIECMYQETFLSKPGFNFNCDISKHTHAHTVFIRIEAPSQIDASFCFLTW